MLGKSGVNSKNIYYETPKKGSFGDSDYSLSSLKKEFNLTLDPCAPIEAKQDPKRACCKHYFTEEEDGLKQEWPENSFVNPPFNDIANWIKKGIVQSQKRGTTNVYLLPAYVGTPWWHDYVLLYGVIRYIRGRLKYWRDGGPVSGSPNIDSVIVIFEAPNPKSYPWNKEDDD